MEIGGRNYIRPAFPSFSRKVLVRSNTRMEDFMRFKTPRRSLKILSFTSYLILGVWKSEEVLLLAFELLLKGLPGLNVLL